MGLRQRLGANGRRIPSYWARDNSKGKIEASHVCFVSFRIALASFCGFGGFELNDEGPFRHCRIWAARGEAAYAGLSRLEVHNRDSAFAAQCRARAAIGGRIWHSPLVYQHGGAVRIARS